ncbi:MAG: hypothetical protein BJ554DRAFT_5533, partial [Olpidium bornovanus]
FRSFTQTLRSFEADIKADKEKGFEVSQIIDEMFDCVRASDIRALFGYWAHLDRRYFSKLEAKFSATVKKLEVSLLRYYLVFAAQQRRRDKLMEFFETYGSDLHPAEEWMACPPVLFEAGEQRGFRHVLHEYVAGHLQIVPAQLPQRDILPHAYVLLLGVPSCPAPRRVLQIPHRLYFYSAAVPLEIPSREATNADIGA